MGNIRYQRTAHRITSAVNCRPLKPSRRSICPAAPYPTGVIYFHRGVRLSAKGALGCENPTKTIFEQSKSCPVPPKDVRNTSI
jgi:hypothetical protein